MSDKTGISWTDATWNPVVGCTKVSAGCDNCYIDRTPPFRIEGRHFTEACPECSGLGGLAAVAYAGRVEVAPPCPTCQGTGRVRSHAIGSTTGVRLHPGRLDQPLRWRKPRRIFVNSLSDLFHEDVPDDFIARVFAVMACPATPTRSHETRHGRMRSLLRSDDFRPAVEDAMRGMVAAYRTERTWYKAWPLPNLWLGVSVEGQATAGLRIPALLDTPAAVRWISAEPLLGPVDLSGLMQCFRCKTTHRFGPCDPMGRPSPYGALSKRHIDWVVVGGESGPGARPMHPTWARSLRDQCASTGVAFHFKQWGEWAPHNLGTERAREVMSRIGRHRAGDLLDGRQHHEWPVIL